MGQIIYFRRYGTNNFFRRYKIRTDSNNPIHPLQITNRCELQNDTQVRTNGLTFLSLD